MKTSKVNIGIVENDRKHIAKSLSVLLADTYTLYLKTQNFHWNVTGATFSELHLLFEKQYQDLALATDDIAESIRALGVPTPATFKEFQKRTTIKESIGVPKAKEMIQQLIDGQTIILATARKAFLQAEKAKDAATADLLTKRMNVHEKNAWMLRSLLD